MFSLMECTCTVAHFDGSIVTVFSEEDNFFQIPQVLLPENITPGSILRLTVESDNEKEVERRHAIYKLIDDIAVHIRSKSTGTPVPQIAASGRRSRRGSADTISL